MLQIKQYKVTIFKFGPKR